MNSGDTSIGGERKGFPETTWSLVSRFKGTDGVRDRAGLELLCRRYWKPVYRFVRMSWAKSNDDAKDLAQAFFLWLLEGDALTRYEPDRGSFRAWLTVVLSRFSNHRERALHRLKRGGGVRTFTLDGELATVQEALPAAAGADPQKIFDREWLDEVVRHAVARTRGRFASGPDLVRFQVFEEYALADPEERPSYPALAAKLGLKESDVRNHLFAVREALREEMRAELREQTSDEGSFEEEWRALFGG